jgi:hypothetical protein
MTFSDNHSHEEVLRRQKDGRRTEWLPFSRASRGYLSRPSDGRTGKDSRVLLYFVNVENVRLSTQAPFCFGRNTEEKTHHAILDVRTEHSTERTR